MGNSFRDSHYLSWIYLFFLFIKYRHFIWVLICSILTNIRIFVIAPAIEPVLRWRFIRGDRYAILVAAFTVVGVLGPERIRNSCSTLRPHELIVYRQIIESYPRLVNSVLVEKSLGGPILVRIVDFQQSSSVEATIVSCPEPSYTPMSNPNPSSTDCSVFGTNPGCANYEEQGNDKDAGIHCARELNTMWKIGEQPTDWVIFAIIAGDLYNQWGRELMSLISKYNHGKMMGNLFMFLFFMSLITNDRRQNMYYWSEGKKLEILYVRFEGR